MKLLFSTDVTMDPIEVLEYYHCRFQMEFNFRDAKQSTGLTHSQARDLNKLHFHFNTSLTTINIVKAMHLCDETMRAKPFSMSDYKIEFHNAFMLNQLIATFGIQPNVVKNHHHVKELLYFGTRAS